MNNLRLLIATLACLAGSAVCIKRYYFQTQPGRDQLEKIEAVVSAVSSGSRSNRHTGETRYPVLRLRGRSEEFKYLDWFPQPHRIAAEIKAGDAVELLSDTNDGAWIWELSKNGSTIVSYNEILAAVRNNNRFDHYIGFGLLACGAFGVYRLLKK